MKRKEFLDLLRFYLSSLPKVVIDDIVSDYYEHFDIGMKEGKTEEEISNSLGSPQDIANEYLENEVNNIISPNKKENINNENETKNYHKEKNKANDSEKKKKTNVFVIILAVLGGLTLLPFLGGVGAGILGLVIGILALIFGLIISVFAVGVSLLVTAIALPLSFVIALPSFISFPSFIYGISMPTRMLFSLALFFISILVIMAGIGIIKLIFKLIKNTFISIKWKINRRKNK